MMTRGNTYVCATCGNTFTYCPKCAVTPPKYDAERYCSKDCSDIFSILSKHGCGLATAEETIKDLNIYDLTILRKSIKEHVDSLKPAKVETKLGKEEESPIEDRTLFKKK